MSVKVMGLVWDANLPRNEKYILLAYADHADHDGNNIYPAVATIAKKTGYDERTVQRVTRLLTDRKILIPKGTSEYDTNLFSVNIKLLKQYAEDTPPGKMSPPPKKANGQNVTPPPLAKCHPNRPINRPYLLLT